MPGLNGFLASLALAAAFPQAQDSPADRETAALVDSARRLLESEDPREQSWGAWTAAERRLTELAPLVEDRLRAALKQEKPKPRHIQALCDTLIQNHPILPPEDIERLREKGFGTLALIFAACKPEASHPMLLSIATKDSEDYDSWVAACNLLLRMKSANFTTSCLEKLRIECHVLLQIEGSGWGSGGGARHTVRCGDGLLRRDEGWPPVVLYDITLKAAPGNILLAEGPANAFQRRNVYHRDSGIGSVSSSNDRDAYRLECLRSLADGDPNARDGMATASLKPSRTVIWKDADRLAQDLREIRRELREPWLELCRVLRQQDLLPPDFADDRFPAIRLKIEDHRPEEHKTPLPPDLPE
jgi:hypothetical protein